MRRLFAMSLTLLAFFSVNGCGRDSKSGKLERPLQSSLPTQTTVVATPDAVKRLKSLILTGVPSGFVLQDEIATDTGPVGLAKAIRDDVSVNAARTLQRAGFRNGYQRTWLSVSGLDRNTILLYEFATPAGARGFTDHWLANLTSSSSGSGVRVFEPPLVPNSIGVSVANSVSSTAIALASKGRFAVQAIAEGARSENQENAVAALVAAQLARLPA